MDSFDYLVRLSKYKDHQGDLDSAIYYMEEAQDLLLSHQKERKLWSTANLADMYGHAGRVKDSYEKYLEVLAMDSSYDYALKGIAWVAYSHDKNPKEAIAILEKLQTKTAMPDHFLLMSEMSEFGGDSERAEWYKTRFVEEAAKSQYEGMYNKYLIEIYLEKGAFVHAMELAEEEVQKRPTPAAYDWMAWTLYKQGKMNKAIEVYQNNVEGQTHEPDVIHHMGVVYYNAGKSNGREYLLESLEASYELGPLTEQEIRRELEG